MHSHSALLLLLTFATFIWVPIRGVASVWHDKCIILVCRMWDEYRRAPYPICLVRPFLVAMFLATYVVSSAR
ncbi:hypothetical protein PISMIDRAFT_679941 [Pisolithus microcarpus 441]|uniref:Secreted peptide n=1 Tax=Pisolithus microcarpus 441 TaxID=765257 RepID=A0A0C9Z9Q1_9AGAM|nr:hypothetical protein BKA83DRAFT_679941 [Pisolithus microcarpus]KIK22724.1 hypothetical protein PISMIDRAFT_679941 [Pisolithus microcarpus 441]